MFEWIDSYKNQSLNNNIDTSNLTPEQLKSCTEEINEKTRNTISKCVEISNKTKNDINIELKNINNKINWKTIWFWFDHSKEGWVDDSNIYSTLWSKLWNININSKAWIKWQFDSDITSYWEFNTSYTNKISDNDITSKKWDIIPDNESVSINSNINYEKINWYNNNDLWINIWYQKNIWKNKLSIKWGTNIKTEEWINSNNKNINIDYTNENEENIIATYSNEKIDNENITNYNLNYSKKNVNASYSNKRSDSENTTDYNINSNIWNIALNWSISNINNTNSKSNEKSWEIKYNTDSWKFNPYLKNLNTEEINWTDIIKNNNTTIWVTWDIWLKNWSLSYDINSSNWTNWKDSNLNLTYSWKEIDAEWSLSHNWTNWKTELNASLKWIYEKTWLEYIVTASYDEESKGSIYGSLSQSF